MPMCVWCIYNIIHKYMYIHYPICSVLLLFKIGCSNTLKEIAMSS